MRDGDALLVFWLTAAFAYDLLIFGATAYAVFWKGHSGWWFLIAIIVTMQPTLFKALAKRFDVGEASSD